MSRHTENVTKSFKNPKDGLIHNGDIRIELTDDAPANFDPVLVEIEDGTATLKSVHIEQIGEFGESFKLQSRREVFYLSDRSVKTIRDNNGNLLWVNHYPM